MNWLPHPVLSLLIAACWMLLQGSAAPPEWIAGLALGVVLPRVLRRFLGTRLLTRRWRAVPRLAARVAWDIVRANVAVAAIVLNPWFRPRPAWVRVPVALEQPGAVALLATIITSTPGTVTCTVDESRGELLVHALHCEDPAALAAQIRARYEAPLKELFS